jgi:hypothetical protein
LILSGAFTYSASLHHLLDPLLNGVQVKKFSGAQKSGIEEDQTNQRFGAGKACPVIPLKPCL